MGRPTKLTPEVQDKICTAIRAGNYAEVAAVYAGIGETTYYRWMEEGLAAQSGVKREFWEAVQKAKADAETREVAIIEQHATDSWQAAAWLLERKHHSRWGRKVTQEVKGEGESGEIVIRVKYGDD